MKFAFVFPGQGSQSVGMLDAFADDATVAQVLQRASVALGEDVGALIANGPTETLNLTVNTQPCMLTAGFAVFAAWRAAGGPMPAVMAGHSLGEYTALAASGVLPFEDAVRLVRFRATVMQEAVPVGAGGMAAILGLSDELVRQACREVAGSEVVEAANFNAPLQVVIAGHKAAVERACEAAKRLGAKRAMPLPVSAPFHSSLLAPARDRLRAELSNLVLSAPLVPVVNNIDVAVEDDAERIRDALARQAAGPVRWSETMARLAADGITHVIECGPGKVLSGLVRRAAPGIEAFSMVDPTSLQDIMKKVRG